MTSRISLTIGLSAFIWASTPRLSHTASVWIGTWESSPAGLPTMAKIGSLVVPPPATISGTVRFRLQISAGGNHIRLKVSNQYGNRALDIASVSVGVAGDGLDATPGTLKRVTFARQIAISLPAGASVLSDPVDLRVEPLADLVVSLYIPHGVTVTEWPDTSSQTGPIVVDSFDATFLEHLRAPVGPWIRPIVSEVDVLSDRPYKVIVTLGDSITDGGIDAQTGARGWPGILSRRVQAQNFSVVNAGIGGNRLLESKPPIFGASGLARLNQDVFAVPGVSHVVVLEGINDIGSSGPGGRFGDTPILTPDELITGFTQIIERAHKHGIKVIGATILPFEGAEYYSVEKESIRVAVNQWIRTSKDFDEIIDFDAALRDPANPTRLGPTYDSGDHLHPNLAGRHKMAAVVDVRIFQ